MKSQINTIYHEAKQQLVSPRVHVDLIIEKRRKTHILAANPPSVTTASLQYILNNERTNAQNLPPP